MSEFDLFSLFEWATPHPTRVRSVSVLGLLQIVFSFDSLGSDFGRLFSFLTLFLLFQYFGLFLTLSQFESLVSLFAIFVQSAVNWV